MQHLDQLVIIIIRCVPAPVGHLITNRHLQLHFASDRNSDACSSVFVRPSVSCRSLIVISPCLVSRFRLCINRHNLIASYMLLTVQEIFVPLICMKLGRGPIVSYSTFRPSRICADQRNV